MALKYIYVGFFSCELPLHRIDEYGIVFIKWFHLFTLQDIDLVFFLIKLGFVFPLKKYFPTNYPFNFGLFTLA